MGKKRLQKCVPRHYLVHEFLRLVDCERAPMGLPGYNTGKIFILNRIQHVMQAPIERTSHTSSGNRTGVIALRVRSVRHLHLQARCVAVCELRHGLAGLEFGHALRFSHTIRVICYKVAKEGVLLGLRRCFEVCPET